MDIKLFAFSLETFYNLTNFKFFHATKIVNTCECAIDEGSTHQVYNKSICQILHAYCTCNVEIMLMFNHTQHHSRNIFSTFVKLSSAVALLLTHFNAEQSFALSSNWCADIFALFNPCFM